MKKLSELKLDLDLRPNECSSQIKYFKSKNIDWNVYLPTKNCDLQREFCWNLQQKREIIWSILMGRHIPHMSIINTINVNDENNDIYLIIDGKQRLSSIFDFIDNKFTLEIDGVEYLFSELPDEYQRCIIYYHFRYYVINEQYGKPITDNQKIAWFKHINFAGTEQDVRHMNKLK